ncbi:MAG: hypothetical protein KDC52_03800, partial [Ignavibacteriae bacterium]|nr:hypothetical protein [Ignavibacteriota bacterium]
NKWTTFQSNEQECPDGVVDLAADMNNTIWIGLSGNPPNGKIIPRIGGLYTIKNNKIAKANLSIPYEDIFDLYIEDDNTVWVGTSVGFYSGQFSEQFKFRYGGSIFSSCKDQKGNLWIGTNDNGIVKYKKWKN